MTETESAGSAPGAEITLTALEARVLGVLIEKGATTPDVYPLTLNATQVGCNQKTSREPIMHAELGDVGHTLRTLEEKGLAREVRSARALRYEHRIDAALGLAPRARAVIALLLLRGPQTQSELLTRSDRLADFSDLAALGDTLERLAQRAPPLVVNLGRAAGQREDRWMHLLSGPVAPELLATRRDTSPAAEARGDLETRVEELERLVAELQRRVESGG